MHPLLFAAYPVLFLYAQNVDFVPWTDAFLPVTVVLAAAFFLLLVLYAILRDAAKAGLLVSLLALLFFSYGRVADLLQGFPLPLPGSTTGQNAVLIALWVLLLAAGVHSLLKMHRDPHNVNYLLKVVAAVLILFPLARVAAYHLDRAGRTGSSGEETS